VKMGTTANQKKLFFNLRKAKSRMSALEEGEASPSSRRHEPPAQRRHVAQFAGG
jgi:RNA polymerase sigma-32 factor